MEEIKRYGVIRSQRVCRSKDKESSPIGHLQRGLPGRGVLSGAIRQTEPVAGAHGGEVWRRLVKLGKRFSHQSY